MQKIRGAGLTNAENGAVKAGGGRGGDYYFMVQDFYVVDFYGVRKADWVEKE